MPGVFWANSSVSSTSALRRSFLCSQGVEPKSRHKHGHDGCMNMRHHETVHFWYFWRSKGLPESKTKFFGTGSTSYGHGVVERLFVMLLFLKLQNHTGQTQQYCQHLGGAEIKTPNLVSLKLWREICCCKMCTYSIRVFENINHKLARPQYLWNRRAEWWQVQAEPIGEEVPRHYRHDLLSWYLHLCGWGQHASSAEESTMQLWWVRSRRESKRWFRSLWFRLE